MQCENLSNALITNIFIFSSTFDQIHHTMQMAKSVEEYIDSNPESAELLHKLRSILLRTELNEELKWGIPYYTLKKKQVVGLVAFKKYTGMWFTNGVFLSDPKKVLVNASDNKTKGQRQWRFTALDQINEDLVYVYILEAIENQKEGKEIKPEPKKLALPEELDQALKSDSSLKLAFQQLSRGKQIEYANHIGEAKQDATRINWLRKSIPLIMNGIGTNDKYR